MDLKTSYQQIVRKELEYQASIRIANAPDVKQHLVINDSNLEFVLLILGWKGKSYRHTVLFHVEIKENKVWIHQDNTDIGIAAVFAEKGIPKSEIILGFLPWYEREVSTFGLAD